MNRDFIDTYNLYVGGIVTILTAVFGVYWYVFLAYILLNIADWLSGWAKAKKLKNESSAKGLMGIVKKLGYWLLIAVAFILANVFVSLGNDVLGIDLSFLNLIGWFTLACLIVNEARSIVENLVEMGYEVPKVLINGLEITEKMLNKDSESDH